MLGWVSVRFFNSQTFSLGWSAILTSSGTSSKMCFNNNVWFTALFFVFFFNMDHRPINREEGDAVTCPQGIAFNSFLNSLLSALAYTDKVMLAAAITQGKEV